MIGNARLWLPWFLPGSGGLFPVEARHSRTAGVQLRVACPHCTNTDTLSLHCRDTRCGWVHCTCGALIYSSRRHRHPRHGGDADTCHDPTAAV